MCWLIGCIVADRSFGIDVHKSLQAYDVAYVSKRLVYKLPRMTSKDSGQSSLETLRTIFQTLGPTWAASGSPTVPQCLLFLDAALHSPVEHVPTYVPNQAWKQANRWIGWSDVCNEYLKQQKLICFPAVGRMLERKGSLISENINYTWVRSAVMCLHGKNWPAKSQRYILTKMMDKID